MEKYRLKPWRLLSAKPTDKAITRDGREVPDVMPDVMKAIEAAKRGDTTLIRLANKHSPYERSEGGINGRYYLCSDSD